MKRVLSLITVLVLILGLAVPSLSLAAPKTPSIKKATAEANAVTLTWKAVKGAQGYKIAWGRKGVSDLLDDTATTTGTSVRVAGLSEGTTYAFRICAYYKKGSKVKYTSWSAKKFVTTSTSVPATPVISSISSSNSRVTLTWNKDSRAAGYEVRWDEKGTLGWRWKAVDITSGSYTASNGITAGRNMAFQVRAYWWKGSSLKYTDWSSTVYILAQGGGSGSASGSQNGSGYWSAWSEPTKTRKQVTANMQERVVYHWWAAQCKSCGAHNPYWGSNIKCLHCGKGLAKSNVKHVNIYEVENHQHQTLNGRKDGAVINGLNYWFCEIQYQYRYWIRK